MKKVYGYIKFKLASPLAIGSGQSKTTDKDVIRNSKGEPFIPATALAGVYRSLFDEKEQKTYFGFIEKDAKNKESAKNSQFIIYDAELCKGGEIALRDGVGLDKYRTAKDGAKYDFEVVEKGAEFRTFIEYDMEGDNRQPFDRIMAAWKNNEIRLGGKTTRGLGQLESVDEKEKMFHLPDEADAWLDFDVYDLEETSWEGWVQKSNLTPGLAEEVTLTIALHQESPLTIRVYTTEVSQNGETAPDYCQLTVANDAKTAIIPGTSWAGAFRHNMAKYLRKDYQQAEKDLEDWYGRAFGNAKRSGIRFSETYLSGGQLKLVSRNAIDRFSGGTVDGALFTEKMYYGDARGKLEISFPMKRTEKDFTKELAASVADLHEGFLSVGGESSIGHGLFTIEELRINGKPILAGKEVSGEALYNAIVNEVKGGPVHG